jgi:hypothetical protein
MNKLLIAFLVVLVLSAGGALVLFLLYHSRCSSCENGCEFTMGIVAKQCKCKSCRTGAKCDKHGKCVCPPKCIAPSGECQKDGSCECKLGYAGDDCTTSPPPSPPLSKNLTDFLEWALGNLKDECPGVSTAAIARVMQKADNYKHGNLADDLESLARLKADFCSKHEGYST